MIKTKYIVYNNNGFKDIIVFSSFETHYDISKRLNLHPVSAGFISIHTNSDTSEVNVSCYGESTSLELKPGEDDEDIARRMLGLL